MCAEGWQEGHGKHKEKEASHEYMNILSGSGIDSNMEKLIMHSYDTQETPNAGMSQEAVTQMIDFGRTPQEITSD